MVVDFALGRAPAANVVTVRWKGPWNERRIRKEFESLARWAADHKLRTGRWIFLEPGERKWQVAIEVRGKAPTGGRIRRQHLPASSVARVVFNPDEVSPRVVYHGLTDWLRWRRKDKTIRRVGAYREVYQGNPWKDPRAWHRTAVEVVVHK